jgi:Protein of unknown function (DUF1552)
MFLTRKYISRRAVLRGAGVTLGLPFLDAMAPAQTPLRRTAAYPQPRLACIEMVHGAAGSTPEGAARHYWSPAQEGAAFDLSFSLEPLAPFRDYLTIVSGTDARPADAQTPSEGGADHFRSSAVFLTAAHAKQTAGRDVENGASIDQLYARMAGRETRVPSLQLCIENVIPGGSCGFNYNCIYSETISWASPDEPLPMMVNPRVVFESLFRDRGVGVPWPPAGSILDGALPAAAHFQGSLGPSDRNRVDAWMAAVRAIEQRIQAVEKRNAIAAERELPLAPLGVPDSWEEHVRLMFDLQALAFASDVTRVSAFKMSRDTSNRMFPESGVRFPFHTLSHHLEKPELIAEFAKLNRYHVGMLPYFLKKLQDTPDGDGNLLNHTLVLYGSPMGDSNTHNHRRLPILLAGHACGKLKGNLHRVCPDGTPHSNTLLTILHKLGVGAGGIGDSTGEIDI